MTFIDWFADETWKDIEGYNQAYKISNKGRVLSVSRTVRENSIHGKVKTKEMILSQREDQKGYMRVYLNDNGRTKFVSVHRLVAIAFIENPENKPQVNHIDGNKKNNNATNLEWCTNSENQIHAYKLGLNKQTGRSGRKKIPVVAVNSSNRNEQYWFDSINDAAQKTNTHPQNIRKVMLGERKTANGFIWKRGDAK